MRGLIGLAGPYDFLPLESEISKAVFGFPDTPLSTQPIRFVSAASRAGAARHRGRRCRRAPAEHPAARVPAARKRGGGAGSSLLSVSHLMLVGALAAPYRKICPRARRRGGIRDPLGDNGEPLGSGLTGAASRGLGNLQAHQALERRAVARKSAERARCTMRPRSISTASCVSDSAISVCCSTSIDGGAFVAPSSRVIAQSPRR